MGKLATTALLIEHQIDAIKAVYHGTVDSRTIASAYPSLSRTKSNIFFLMIYARTFTSIPYTQLISDPVDCVVVVG